MKRMKKLIAALLLCVLVLSCAGCANLDEMKASHAVWTDEEQTALEWNGATYKKLPTSSALEIWDHSEKNVFITAPDVPVLLVEQFGSPLNCSKDEVLLQSIHWSENDYPVFYCRADRYDELVKQITEGVQMPKIIYTYWSFEDDLNHMVCFTDAQKQAVETVLKTNPISLGYNGYDEEYSIDLYRSSENHIFREMLCYISALNGQYRIIVPGPEDMLYEIPAELQPTFEAIMAPYEKDYWNNY